MRNSKLLDLLHTLSNREWKAFIHFMHSPYFNRDPELIRLVEWLQQQAPNFSDVTKANAWNALYSEKQLDSKQLNHIMSWLLKLGEQFLGLEHSIAGGFETEYHKAEALLARGLEKHYQFNTERLQRQLNSSPYRDGAFLLKQYRLAELKLRAQEEHASSRQTDDHLQQASNQLDYFYFTEKLRHACTMLNNQTIISSAYQFHFVDELRRFVEHNATPPEAPGIALYFRIFQMLSKENGDADFQVLKQLLQQFANAFSHTEMAWLYSYALNFCIRQIRNVREEYVEEALQLYGQGIESGILLNNKGWLSPWHFKNIVKLGLRVQRYEWTERFILEKNALLEREFKTDALHYNLADLYFYTSRYDAALEHLNQVEFSDVHYNLGAKEMLAKIYYETEAHDALDSLLHAFKTYLHRNRVITDTVRKAYLNFIKLLRRLLQITADQVPAFVIRIEKADPLTAKNWLLEQTKKK